MPALSIHILAHYPFGTFYRTPKYANSEPGITHAVNTLPLARSLFPHDWFPLVIQISV